jgi:tRNA nucleotidyltransferase/poly(A) polymerase
VRDTLLGKTPKDWDVATDAPPNRIRQIFPDTQAVGAAFGVILVRQGKSVVEVATFRSDGEYADGRRPDSVHFTTAEEDAQRRDFTINGLFFDPIENRIIDFVGGQADLDARVLRAIGDSRKRFSEDHLRMLRAVRFASRYDFHIEPETARAITEAAPKLKRISPERIGDELRRMLTPISRKIAWPLLWELNLAREILRFLPRLPQAMNASRSLFLKLAPDQEISFGVALAGTAICTQLLQDPSFDVRVLLDRKEIHQSEHAMRQALRISNDESDEIKQTLEGAGLMLAETFPGLAARKRFMARPTAKLSRMLLDALAGCGQHADRIAEIQSKLKNLESIDCAPMPLITGDDLTAKGLNPGPIFKQILDSVYDAQLEGKISTREQAMEMAMRFSAEKSQ